jgi:dienelactone hydrolase
MRSVRAGTALVLLAAFASCAYPPRAQTRGPSSIEGFFENGDVRLSYRLDRPEGRGPFPAVVVGHGSGRVTKNEFQAFADGLLRRGFAVLRYDKRGVGASTGTFVFVGTLDSEQVFPELAGDMAAGVAFLRSQPDIIGTRVGLMGASQAGWIIPLAARRANAAFMIITSGPTVSVGEEIFFSRIAEGKADALERAYAELPRYTGPRGFDPVPTLESLDVPGLWLLGRADDSIPERDTVAILKRLIAGGRPFSFVEYPNAGHGLTDRSTGVSAPIWADIDRWLTTCCPARGVPVR